MGRPLVLIVDDDRDTTETLRALFQGSGWQAAAAASAAEAFDLAVTNVPDLVMFVTLPDMTGPELRREAGCAEAVIVAVSGWDDEETRDSALKAGCDDYLVKPLTFAELLGPLRGTRLAPLLSASLPGKELQAS